MMELFQGVLVYCPLCEKWFSRSTYLSTVFPASSHSLWFANMVMHYRHEHVVYYNHSVHYNSWHGRYENFKSEVNERAKRQILRGAKRFLREHGFMADDLDELQGHDEGDARVRPQTARGVAHPPPGRPACRGTVR